MSVWARAKKRVEHLTTSPLVWIPRLRSQPLDHAYQERFMSKVPSTGVIVDVGSGAHPFARATILGERNLGDTQHRKDALARDARPLLALDVEHLPFRDRSVDYLYCSHVLEHVDDPLRACREIQRVAKAGYIETPTAMKDALFGWAIELGHRWHVVRVKDRLVFFEYEPRQREGVRSDSWVRSIFTRMYHPNQDLFFHNLDIFNTILVWQGGCDMHVHRLDGSFASL